MAGAGLGRSGASDGYCVPTRYPNSLHEKGGIAVKYLTAGEKEAVAELKEALRDVLGDRLMGLYLFGSKARGDYDALFKKLTYSLFIFLGTGTICCAIKQFP